MAKDLLDEYKDTIVLPTDFAVIKDFKDPTGSDSFSYVTEIPDDQMAVDI